MNSLLFLGLISSSFVNVEVFANEIEITVNVDPGKEDCFYQDVKQGKIIDFEYQVIDGGHGDLDITFRIADPNGRIIVADFKKPEYTHRVDAAMSGDYKFCFDNTYSSYNTKTVFFAILLDDDDGDEDNESDEVNDTQVNNFMKSIGDVEVQIRDVVHVLDAVKSHLGKAHHLQELVMSFETRDRNIAERNYFKVNFFSFVQIMLMLVVGLVQVIMVKSLFNVDSKVHKIWKKIDPN